MSEPDILVPSREQLIFLLTEAAEIEHGLMCCYLYAAFGLKRGEAEGLSVNEAAAVERWRRTILSVAVDEMLHLAHVSNLLTAIGAAPHFLRPNFPVSPGYHPAGVVVHLAPFNEATLDHFVFLERPEGVVIPDGAGFEAPRRYERTARADRLVPSAQDYETVGHLYRGLEQGFQKLSEHLGEGVLFCGEPGAQVDEAMAGLPGLHAVTDLKTALEALEAIVVQGEGSPDNAEDSHYQRFVAIRDEYRALRQRRPDFEPSRPVATNPVMRKPPLPEGKVHVEGPVAGVVIDLANAAYGLMLRLLYRGFGHAQDSAAARQTVFAASIEAMMVMRGLAELLTELPASDERPDLRAGLSFTCPRSLEASLQPGGAWRLLVEGARAMAEGCRAASDLDPRLTSFAERADALAARLLAAAPFDDDEPAPKKRAPPPPPAPMEAAAAPDVKPEVVRGQHLTLQFDTARCIHSRHCVLGAPKVFLANVEGAWIFPDEADVETLAAVAHNCPSGAITYERHDGGPAEVPPPVNVLRVRQNGPLALHAALDIEGEAPRHRATLCRCGASKRKPFCDGSHVGIGFEATGEPASAELVTLSARDGPLCVSPQRDGPLQVSGNLELCSGTGRPLARTQQARLCRCGGSARKPYCDGTHARIGFRSL